MTPGRAARPSCYITTFPVRCCLHLGWPRLGVVTSGVLTCPRCSQPCAARHHSPTLTRPTNPEPHPSLLLMPLPSLLDPCPPGSTPLSPAPPNTTLLPGHSILLPHPAPNRTLALRSTHGCPRAASFPRAAPSSSNLPRVPPSPP